MFYGLPRAKSRATKLVWVAVLLLQIIPGAFGQPPLQGEIGVTDAAYSTILGANDPVLPTTAVDAIIEATSSSSVLNELDVSALPPSLQLIETAYRDDVSSDKECPAGFYCANNEITACPANTYNPDKAKGSVADCLKCKDWEVSTPGSTGCALCAGGFYLDAVGAVSDGEKGVSALRACRQCDRAAYSAQNSTKCFKCPAGTYADKPGTPKCNDCPGGSYQDVEGQTQCYPCDDGTYTYKRIKDPDTQLTTGFEILTRAPVKEYCERLPGPWSGEPTPCLPGDIRYGTSACESCPFGFFCPTISIFETSEKAILTCPNGYYGPKRTKSQEGCTERNNAGIYNYTKCGLIASDAATNELDAFAITAIAGAKGHHRSVFFATKTQVKRLILNKNSDTHIEHVAGSATSGNSVGVYTDARFTDISAVGVDHEHEEATVAVVTDKAFGNIKVIDITKKTVRRLGADNLMTEPAGIALKKTSYGKRWAYISDKTTNVIMRFHVDGASTEYEKVGGVLDTVGGWINGGSGVSRFNGPAGLAFLQNNMETNRHLLICDSRGGGIRKMDTEDHVVSDFYVPLSRESRVNGKFQRELRTPTQISVVRNEDDASDNNYVVLVYDTGFVPPRVVAITRVNPSDNSNDMILTVLDTSKAAEWFGAFSAFIPYPGVKKNETVGLLKHGYGADTLIFLDKDGKLKSLLDDDLAATSLDSAGVCVHPIQSSAATLLPLCGNMYLDDSEECDTGLIDGFGCNNCTIDRKVAACVGDVATCTFPCNAFNHSAKVKRDVASGLTVNYDDYMHCSDECMEQTPATGFRMNKFCEEIDINECAEGLDTRCGATGTVCANTPGDYTCGCLTSYYGDGKSCQAWAYRLYTTIEVSIARATFNTKDNETAGALTDALQNAFIDSFYTDADKLGYETFNLDDDVTQPANYTKSAWNMAKDFISFKQDANTNTDKTRIYVSVLFQSQEKAEANRDKIANRANLGKALTKAYKDALHLASDDTVTITPIQDAFVDLHRASGFDSVVMASATGMEVLGAVFNSSCTIDFYATPKQPTMGCWEISIKYQGGAPESEGNVAGKSPLNVLYLPRIDRSLDTPLVPVSSGQALKSVMSEFSCDTRSAASAIQKKSTACCLYDFERNFRTAKGFADFIQSDVFSGAVPDDFCNSTANWPTLNDTYPSSDVVYGANTADKQSNDFVVGLIDGFEESEVKSVNVIDYVNRIYEVRLTIAEDDLIRGAATSFTGIQGLDYDAKLFVGIAQFTGTGTSVLRTVQSAYSVLLKRSSVLTLSTYGANQDPLVSYASMSLQRIKVANGFNEPPLLYYLQPDIFIPTLYTADLYTGYVPLDGVMLGKSIGGMPVKKWEQACYDSTLGTTGLYTDSLKALVNTAQQQACTGSYLGMCLPSSQVRGTITFGVPLNSEFFNASDFANSKPVTLMLKVLVKAMGGTSGTVLQTVQMGITIDRGQLGVLKLCEEIKAATTLADIVDASILIGLPTNNLEFNSMTIKPKGNIAIPNVSFPVSLEFNTITVGGSFMTFWAMGQDAYFNDTRAKNFVLNIDDIHSVHFLEPINGKTGTSPKFEAVTGLLKENKAYEYVTDEATQKSWLVESQALKDLCPERPEKGKMACIHRVDSTIKNNTRVVSDSITPLLRDDKEADTIAAVQKSYAKAFFQGEENANSKQGGQNVYDTLKNNLKFNNRYRRAYLFNPIYKWSYEAMQTQQPGSNPYTVLSKIMVVALVTVDTGGRGTVAAPGGARRMLSFTMENDWFTPLAQMRTAAALRLPTMEPAMAALLSAGGGRSLMSVDGGNAIAETSALETQSTSLQQIAVDNSYHVKPGAVLCQAVLGVQPEQCAVLETTIVQNDAAQGHALCSQHKANKLVDWLDGQGLMAPLKVYSEGLETGFVHSYDIQGCEAYDTQAAAGAGRGLLAVSAPQQNTGVVTITVNVVASTGASSALEVKKSALENLFKSMNATINVLSATNVGAHAKVSFIVYTTGEGNTTGYTYQAISSNSENYNLSTINDNIDKELQRLGLTRDGMFVNDVTGKIGTSAGYQSAAVFLINTLLAVTLATVAVMH